MAPLLAGVLMFGAGCDEDNPTGPDPDPDPVAHVRGAHMAGDSGTVTAALDAAVDIYAGEDLIISDLSYLDLSGYMEIDVGTHDLRVTETGTQTEVATASVTVVEGGEYTLALFEVGNEFELEMFEDDEADSDSQSLLRIIHASESTGSVDLVTASNMTLVSGLTYRQNSSYHTIDPGTYDIEMRAAGTTNVMTRLNGVAVGAGEALTLWVTGSRQAVLSQDAEEDSMDTSTQIGLFGSAMTMIRTSNFIPVNALIEFHVGDDEFPDLDNAEVSSYMEVTSGSHLVVLHDGVTGTALASVNIAFGAGAQYTLIGGHYLTGTNAPRIRIIRDGTDIPAGQAMVRLIHESPPTEHLKLVDVTGASEVVVISSVTYQDHSDYVEIDPGTHDFELRGTSNNQLYATMTGVEVGADAAWSIFAHGDTGDVDGKIVRDGEPND